MSKIEPSIDLSLRGVTWERIEGEPNPAHDGLPVATHRGILKVADDLSIECFQLDNGQRVISEAGVVAFCVWLGMDGAEASK